MSYASAAAWSTAGKGIQDFGRMIADTVWNNEAREEERKRYREQMAFKEREFTEGSRQFGVSAGLQRRGQDINRDIQGGYLDLSKRRFGLEREQWDWQRPFQELQAGRQYAMGMGNMHANLLNAMRPWGSTSATPNLWQYIGKNLPEYGAWSPEGGINPEMRDQLTAKYMMEVLGKEPSEENMLLFDMTPEDREAFQRLRSRLGGYRFQE